MSKTHAKAAEIISGILVLAFGFAGEFFHEERLVSVLFYASAILTAIIGGYYLLAAEVWPKLWRGVIPPACITFIVFGLVASATSFAVYPRIYPRAALRPFYITPGTAMLSPTAGPPLSGRLAAGHENGNGMILYPVHWLGYVTLANNQDIPTTILGYWASEKANVGAQQTWRDLCNVDLRNNDIFFLGNGLTDATRLIPDQALDRQLSERVIGAHSNVSGWLAWQCPGGFCGPEVKLRIREADGRVSETKPFAFATTEAPLQEPEFRIQDQHLDLTKKRIILGDACSPKGITGGILLAPPQHK
jgi:hypothetical protein